MRTRCLLVPGGFDATLMIAAALLVAVASERSAAATFRDWNVGTGNWGLAGNWSPSGVPNSNDIVTLNHLVSGVRGVATVSGTGFASPISVSIRQLNDLRIANHSALAIQGDMVLGYGDSVGFFTMNSSQPGVLFFDGNLTIGNTMRLGTDGSLGTANQNDGTVTVNQLVRVGDSHHVIPDFPGTGGYNLSGVGVLNAARLEVGYGGDSSQFGCEGTVNLSGNATLNISLGAQIPDPKIGGNGGVGTLNQSGGTLNSPFRIINVGNGAAGSGVYNFSGGTASAAGFAVFPNGTINYTGGSSLNLGQLSTTDGHINVAAGADKVLRASLLWTSPATWKVDLSDNAAIILSLFGDGSMRQLIQRGYNGGAWTGNGITSSAAQGQALASHRTALGFATAIDLFGPGGGTFMGFAVSGNTNLIRYTYYGDANLDLAVDTIDFNVLASHFGSSGVIWDQGDFNYDGSVNTIDFNQLASNFGQVLAGADGGSGALVPEPATITPLAGVLAMFVRRRSRLRDVC